MFTISKPLLVSTHLMVSVIPSVVSVFESGHVLVGHLYSLLSTTSVEIVRGHTELLKELRETHSRDLSCVAAICM